MCILCEFVVFISSHEHLLLYSPVTSIPSPLKTFQQHIHVCVVCVCVCVCVCICVYVCTYVCASMNICTYMRKYIRRWDYHLVRDDGVFTYVRILESIMYVHTYVRRVLIKVPRHR